MADRGITKDCQAFFETLPDTNKDVAEKCGVDQSSLRKFRDGVIVIRRTTFNKISGGLKRSYGIEISAEMHWIPVKDKDKG